MESKSWLHSKTLWFNAAVLLFTYMVDLPAELRALGMSEQTALRVSTIANMGLRFLSTARIVFAVAPQP